MQCEFSIAFDKGYYSKDVACIKGKIKHCYRIDKSWSGRTKTGIETTENVRLSLTLAKKDFRMHA